MTENENTCLETGFPGEIVQEQKTSWTSWKISLGVSSLSSVVTAWLSRGRCVHFYWATESLPQLNQFIPVHS